MNINKLYEKVNSLEEIRIIDKTSEHNDITFNVIGTAKQNDELKLYILQYVKNEQRYRNICDRLTKIEVDTYAYKVFRYSHSSLADGSIDTMSIISKFVSEGWNPQGIDFKKNIWITTISLGKCPLVPPNFNRESVIELIYDQISLNFPVLQKISLDISDSQNNEVTFVDDADGSEYTININRVFMIDVWEEMLTFFNSPPIKNRFNQSEVDNHVKYLEQHFANHYPPGTFFPVVEYECEGDITVEIRSANWSNSESFGKGSDLGFILKSDNFMGKNGLPLKVWIIKEHVEKGTETIEAEIVSYSKMIDLPNIILN